MQAQAHARTCTFSPTHILAQSSCTWCSLAACGFVLLSCVCCVHACRGSAINLQDLGSSLWGEGDNADDAWELIQALSEPDADNALSLIHQQRLMQQEQQQAAGGAPAVNALDGLPPLAQLQPQQPLHAAVPALPSVSASDDDSGSDAEAELSVESDASTAGMAAEDDGWKEDSAHSSTADNSSWGRLEPGVVALAANGPVIATVDTLGE